MPSALDICLFDGFQPDLIYELTYTAKSPWVMGLGYAVTRDLASFLRFADRDDTGRPNPLGAAAATIRRAYAFGVSSTGMYLRDFLYLGFNEDERHRKVFDAMRIAIAGTHRLFMNTEFADPNVYSRQDQHSDFLSHSYPPLTYAVTRDPVSGIRDGILKRPRTDPLIVHVDTANEFWQMNASLNVHDGRGRPVPVPDHVRMYFLASHAHLGASDVAALPDAKGTCDYVTNGNRSSFAAAMRAFLVIVDDWADRGVAPPVSAYPTIANGALVPLAEASKIFPRIPGFRFPTVVNQLEAIDYGSTLRPGGGVISKVPPVRGKPYEVRVPKADADGLDVGGIRTLDIAAPVGTNTGWNLRPSGPRSADLCGLSGAFIPFARTKAERSASGDTRLSLEERYTNHDGFVSAVTNAARDLVKTRFLLQEDAERAIAAARASSILR